MGRIKYLTFIAMLITVGCVVTACGRADNKSTTKAPMSTTAVETTQALPSESYVNDVTNGEYGNTDNKKDESGGVLRDMVDDVERGINNVMDGIDGEMVNRTKNNSEGMNTP